MSRYPYGWLDLLDPDHPLPLLPGDPYAPPVLPVAPVLPEVKEESEDEPEEDPEEDPEEEEEPEEPMEEEGEPFEDEDDYQPYGSDHEEDAQGEDDPPEESLTDEEMMSPPHSPSRTSPPPYRSKGKGPMLPQHARDSDFPNVFHFTAQPGAIPPVGPTLERGESSRVPHLPTPPPGSLAHAAGALEQQVKELKEELQGMHQAIQTLYHRAGASRTEAIAQGVRLREVEHQLYITRSQLNNAELQANVTETDNRRLHELHRELLRRLNHYFGY